MALRKLTKAIALEIPDAALRNNGGSDDLTPPPLFSRPFLEVLATAIDRGHLSVRRAAQLVRLPIEGLEELFAEQGVDCAIDM